MLNLKKQGLTLLLVDQMAGLAMSMADEVGLLQSGQMKFKGTPQDMLDSQILEHTYLNQHETFETPSSL
jgi:ABC-type branched-subunit amino acid transport system ATPase component